MPENSISKIPVQVFSDYIIEKLRRTNPFLKFAVSEDNFVLGGSVVHIPQAGASPAVIKNRKQFPATAVRREDSFITYPLNVFSTDPTHITWHESYEVSYDKQDSVLGDHVATLAEATGDDMIYSWLQGYKGGKTLETIPSTNVFFTTGDSRDVFEEGQTGKRKKLTCKDIQNLAAKFNKMNVGKEGRYLMLESNMYQELIESLSENIAAAVQGAADLANGIVGKYCGFNIIDRSVVCNFTSAGVPIAPGEALQADSCVGGIAWQKDCVAVAMGDTKPFQNIDDPMYYGNIFSALVKTGGRCRRGDWKGIAAIVEGVVE
jgi:hypothetical protein